MVPFSDELLDINGKSRFEFQEHDQNAALPLYCASETSPLDTL